MSEPPRPEMARERGAMSDGLVGVLAGSFDDRLPAGDFAFELGLQCGRRGVGVRRRLGAEFAKLIGKPEIMRLATKYGLPRPTLMKFMLKLMANLPEEKGGGLDDRLVQLMTRVAPDA